MNATRRVSTLLTRWPVAIGLAACGLIAAPASADHHEAPGTPSSQITDAVTQTAEDMAPVGPQPGDPTGWNAAVPEAPDKGVVIRGATVWTSGPKGIQENVDLLVVDGKIAGIGRGLKAKAGVVTIDGSGKHVTPGLIDAHNHTAIVGSVNEPTHSTTAEVRIENLVNAESINVYRQLAGGLTTANLLHGSANAIGGQNAVIKLRWGVAPRDMLMAEAPSGVKFALGENPKQSNWGDNVTQRYPQTRPGVEVSIRERFEAARDYRRAMADHEKAGKGRVPPRPDLQLEAVAEILEGDRLIHSHSYRADEILMLLRLTEAFGIRVASFQHVLEGYKVADELARLGAGASTFSDWWAYKYEVVDAIPHNGTIMWDRGVVVSFNSDDDDLARRMNLEAAKAVRYGGMPEDEALKLVTINPAIQLGIDRWVGSLETGKHGDFVVWSGHPLSTYSIVEQTWVDGRKYFDRTVDLETRAAVEAERRALIEKVRAANSSDEDAEDGDDETDGEGEASEAPPEPSYRVWEFNHDAYCAFHEDHQ